MRAYYLNPNITPEGLKELDALADKHVAVCKEAIASMLPDRDDCEAVRKAKESMLQIVITNMLLFG